MQHIMPLAAFLVLGIFSAASANAAIVKNGIRYTHYNKNTARCPDGGAKLRYAGLYWCRTYKASLSWTPPVRRTNGIPLLSSEIAAYEVYWTRDKDTAKGTLRRGGRSKSTDFYVWTPDVYYFAISAVDTKGSKSPLSKMVSARIGR